MNGEATNDRPVALILRVGGEASAAPAVFGLSAGERLRRSLVRAGIGRIDGFRSGEAPPAASGRTIVLRDDYFYDERLVAALLEGDDCLLVAPGGGGVLEGVPERGGAPIAASVDGTRVAQAVALLDPRSPTPASDDAGLRRVGVHEAAPAYDPRLRRSTPPFAHRVGAESTRETERRIFSASYKGLTDLVTKWVFPTPALAVVRVLSRYGVAPNTVTSFSYVLAAIAAWLFAEGAFAAGLLAGWVMTFLDTVDGKLARCTIRSSRFGDVFDHGLDLVHPPIWWAAWAIGLPGGLEENALAATVVVGGYVVGRALEGIFVLLFGFSVFVWRPFDGVFRTVVARRNPNLLLLSAGVLVGSATAGYTAVAVWTVACLAIAAGRIVLALAVRGRGGEIRPWMASPVNS